MDGPWCPHGASVLGQSGFNVGSMVCPWWVRCAAMICYDASVVLQLWVRDEPMVHPHGASMMLPWWVHRASMVLPWFVLGRSVVSPWCVHDASMVGPWWVYDGFADLS